MRHPVSARMTTRLTAAAARGALSCCTPTWARPTPCGQAISHTRTGKSTARGHALHCGRPGRCHAQRHGLQRPIVPLHLGAHLSLPHPAQGGTTVWADHTESQWLKRQGTGHWHPPGCQNQCPDAPAARQYTHQKLTVAETFTLRAGNTVNRSPFKGLALELFVLAVAMSTMLCLLNRLFTPSCRRVCLANSPSCRKV